MNEYTPRPRIVDVTQLQKQTYISEDLYLAAFLVCRGNVLLRNPPSRRKEGFLAFEFEHSEQMEQDRNDWFCRRGEDINVFLFIDNLQGLRSRCMQQKHATGYYTQPRPTENEER